MLGMIHSDISVKKLILMVLPDIYVTIPIRNLCIVSSLCLINYIVSPKFDKFIYTMFVLLGTYRSIDLMVCFDVLPSVALEDMIL